MFTNSRRSLFVLVVVALVLATGCTSTVATPIPAVVDEPTAPPSVQATNPPPSQADPIEITMLTNWGDNQERGVVLKTLVDEYNQQHAGAVEITLEVNPDWPALQSKIRTMIGSNQTPDLFNYNYNPNDLSVPQSGKLMDFAPYMDSIWRERFRTDDLALLTENSQIVSIPFEQTPVLFYYNKDLFSKAGITEFPKTWDDFLNGCEALKQVDVACLSLMTKDDAWFTTNAFTYLAGSLAGPDAFAVGQSLDNPGIVQAAEQLKELFGYTTPDAVGANYEVASSNFLLGKAAMIIDGPWLISSIKNQMDASQVGVAAAPAAGSSGQAGLIITDAVTPWASGVQGDEAKQQAVADFMKFLTTEENVKRFTLEGNFPMSVKVTLTDAEVEGADPLLVGVIKAANDAPAKVVQVTRVLKPGAIAELPALLESLALDQITPQEFATQLEALNQ